jgi:hypothetical protein
MNLKQFEYAQFKIVAKQTVDSQGSSVQSAAFNLATVAIMIKCNANLSTSIQGFFSIGADPSAIDQADFFLRDGETFVIGVNPGEKIAVNGDGGNCKFHILELGY